MIIKVCGIVNFANFQAISELDIDMIGLNFYKPSKRYLAAPFHARTNPVEKVGVFVDLTPEGIQDKVRTYDLSYAQLHGDQDEYVCDEVASFIPVIKVFRVDRAFDFRKTAGYERCSYFLFDTKTDSFGGSGKKFEWQTLSEYKGEIPFLLSGGIGPADCKELMELEHPAFRGVDINSRFETQPGIKDVAMVKQFVDEIRKKS
jgi:phosphoribosylanthranilate isomerase